MQMMMEMKKEIEDGDCKVREEIRKDAAPHMGHANQTADKHYRVDVSEKCVFLKDVALLSFSF